MRTVVEGGVVNMFQVVPSLRVVSDRVWLPKTAESSPLSTVNPLATAWRWISYGARCIHVQSENASSLSYAVPALLLGCRPSGVELMVGGGIRTPETARLLKALGAHTLVIRAALNEPDRLEKLVQAVGAESLVPSWTVPLNAEEARTFWQSATDAWKSGIRRCILSAPEGFEVGMVGPILHTMASRGWEPWVAGGIMRPQDLVSLQVKGARGCIIGRAFFGEGEETWRPYLRQVPSL